jgi:hypothetical protein
VQEELASHERKFYDTLDAVNASLDNSAADFRDLDSTTSSLAAAATTTGTRLSAAHRISSSARAALDVLSHLWAFSNLPPGVAAGNEPPPAPRRHSDDPADLDPLFFDDSRLSEAAALVHSMLPLAREVHSSNRRLGLARDDLDESGPGTVEAALNNLIAYRNRLENRLMKRFMDACMRQVRPGRFKSTHS